MAEAAKGSLKQGLMSCTCVNDPSKSDTVEAWRSVYGQILDQAKYSHTDPETATLIDGHDQPFASMLNSMPQKNRGTASRSDSNRSFLALREVDKQWRTVGLGRPDLLKWMRIYTGLSALQSMTSTHNCGLAPGDVSSLSDAPIPGTSDPVKEGQQLGDKVDEPGEVDEPGKTI